MRFKVVIHKHGKIFAQALDGDRRVI